MGLRAWSQDQNQSMSHLPFEHIRQGREILLNQAQAINAVGKNVPADFPLAVELIAGCRGAVIVVGIGKAGWIGQKISASLASTGTASHFLHPSEALHLSLIHI